MACYASAPRNLRKQKEGGEMTKEEAISAYIREMKQTAEDAVIDCQRIQATDSSGILFWSADSLSEKANDLYRLAIRIQTLESIDSLTTN